MSTHSQEAPKPAGEDRVPLGEKAAFGIGGITGALANNIDNGLLRPIFVVTYGVSPALLSTCDVIYRVWDALTDVAMGWISDNTRTRWGRRRPYLVAGAVLTSLVMPFLWAFDPAWPMNTIIAWMIGVQLTLFLCFTIWNVPYQSLQMEITPSSAERTNVIAFRGYFTWAPWMLIGWAWSLAQLPFFNDPSGEPNLQRGAFWITVGAAFVCLVCGVIPGIFCRERFYHQAVKQEKVPLLAATRMALQNTVFLRLALISFCYLVGTAGTEGLGFFVKLYYVFDGDQKAAAALAGTTGTIGLLLGVAKIPVIQWFARRFGKRLALALALGLSLFAAVLTWFTFTPAHPYLSVINAVLHGLANGVVWVMIPSLLGDVADHDDLRTGTRREGVFAAMYSWVHKVSGTVAAAGSGFLVVWAGFDAKLGAAQPDDVVTTMRIALVVVPTVLLSLGIFLTASFPLTTRRMEEIRGQLDARRAAI